MGLRFLLVMLATAFLLFPVTNANLILLWDGAGNAPNSDWECISCSSGSPFYNRLPRGAATYGSTGGSAAHSHSLRLVSCSGPSALDTNWRTGTPAVSLPTTTHTHTIASYTVASASNYPLYRSLKFIVYKSGVPEQLPAGVIGIFNSTIPTGWTEYTAMNGYYLLGNGTIATGGSNNHTHSVSITTGAPSANTNYRSGATSAPTATHTHTGSGTSQRVDNQPPYIRVRFAKLNSAAKIPDGSSGLIAMFNSTPPLGWRVVSNSNGPFYQRFVLGAASYGSTGGSPTHNHTAISITTGGPTVSNSRSTAAVTGPSATHTHTIVAAFNLTGHLPPYREVIFAFAANLGLVPPVVKAISPPNNTAELTSKRIIFYYNVSSTESITNCTLFVDGSYKNHTNSPQKDTTLTLSASLENGQRSWLINCTDSWGIKGSTGRYNLSVQVYIPAITSIEIENPINLLAGSLKRLDCNGTAYDGNGHSNIASINATFYNSGGGYKSNSPNHNSSHYSTQCTLFGGSGNSLNFHCRFNITYYANAGEWSCNASVRDAQAHTNSSVRKTNVSRLYAIKLDSSLIDYGQLPPLQPSTEKTLNIENEGNVPINISVRGFGAKSGDGVAMVCKSGNVSLSDERYSPSLGTPFALMTPLTSAFSKISGFTINKTNSSLPSKKPLYWRVSPSAGAEGNCTGTIVLAVVVG